MNRTYDKKLLEKLSKSLDKPEKYIREQISKRAGSLGVLPETYFILSLMKNKVSVGKYIKTLDAETRNEIQQNRSLITQTVRQKVSTKPLSTQRIIKKKGGKESSAIPSLLSLKEIQSAKANLKYYETIYLMENSTRNFISYFLEKEYGVNWWTHSKGQKAVVRRKIKDNVKSRKEEEALDPINEPRGQHDLHYTDFNDLATIIEDNKDAVFDPVCLMLQGNSTFIYQILRRLTPSRNSIAHMGNLSKKDAKRIELDWSDMYSAYKRIEKDIIK
ncbi:MAG: Swt1 family HEPN domain-containing protein [Candidatus Paceibacterota bacterium]|jgi:hypothetical protein